MSARLIGPDARLTFAFEDSPRISHRRQAQLFVHQCLERGVLTNGNLLPSYAIDDASLERSIEVFEAALAVVAGALSGSPSAPLPLSAHGFLERLEEEDGYLHVAGWLLLDDRPADTIEVVAPSGRQTRAELVTRPDVAQAFPELGSPERAGYEASIPAPEVLDGDEFSFTIVASRNGSVAFRCRVVGSSLEGASGFGPRSTNEGFLCY